MSLLMKALEKAAQDRDKTPAADAAAGSVKRELTLEGVEFKTGIQADENTSRVAISPKRAAAAPHSSLLTPTPTLQPAHSAFATTSAAGKESSDAQAPQANQGTQARASAVLNANSANAQASGAGAMAWLAAHPVHVVGTLAALILLFYGGYVYVQIAHPGLLLKSPPRTQPAVVAATPVAAPVPGTVNPLSTGAPQSADPAQSSFVTTQSVFGGRTGSSASATSATSPTSASSGSTSNETSGSVPPQQQQRSVAAVPQPGATPAVAPLSARVAVSRGDNATARINPVVSEAYGALESRQFDAAQRLYAQVLRSEPNNVDALLGLAAIAQHENRVEDAQRYFMSILNVEPRNALAQSGLVAAMSRADPQAAESRLKQLLAREPSPPLFFNLGNLYAEQGQWAQAQQAYFQAHNLDPRNPDYAYNLAVGLEHIGQQKLALDFYRKALQLASDKGSANFDSARIQERITQLAARAN